LQSNLVSYAQLEGKVLIYCYPLVHTQTQLYVLLTVMSFLPTRSFDAIHAYRLYTTPRQDLSCLQRGRWNDIGSTAVLRRSRYSIPTRKRHEVVPQTMTISQCTTLCHLNQWILFAYRRIPLQAYEIKDQKSYQSANTARQRQANSHYPHRPPRATRPMMRSF